MSGACYVLGCDDSPIVRFKYRDSLGAICIEARCSLCAVKLRESDRTTVLEEVALGTDSSPDANYHELTEEEKRLIRRLTDGPYGRFAA